MSGAIRAGMVVRFGAERGFEGATVVAVELVDHPDGRAEVALRIAGKDLEEESFVAALCADGNTQIGRLIRRERKVSTSAHRGD